MLDVHLQFRGTVSWYTASKIEFRTSLGAVGQGATAAEKLMATKVWVQTPGRLHPASGHMPGLGFRCGRGSPPPAVGVRGITPEFFWKNQMLNPAFW